MADAIACVSVAFASAASPSLSAVGVEGELSVFRAEAFGPEPVALTAGWPSDLLLLEAGLVGMGILALIEGV
ncbi:MAG: hypothetical protein M3N82_00225 [Pseudomonadota bacterium]|nr:hypothetical protein [Pseudomonadota bacterium]